MGRLGLEQSWRSPEGRDTLGSSRARKPPPQQENDHVQVYRAGCLCVKLYTRSDDAERETGWDPCGGDERTVPDRSGAADCVFRSRGTSAWKKAPGLDLRPEPSVHRFRGTDTRLMKRPFTQNSCHSLARGTALASTIIAIRSFSSSQARWAAGKSRSYSSANLLSSSSELMRTLNRRLWVPAHRETRGSVPILKGNVPTALFIHQESRITPRSRGHRESLWGRERKRSCAPAAYHHGTDTTSSTHV